MIHKLTLTDLMRGPGCLDGHVVSLTRETLLALDAATRADPTLEAQLVGAGWAAPQIAGMFRYAKDARETRDHIVKLNAEGALMDEMRAKKLYWFQR